MAMALALAMAMAMALAEAMALALAMAMALALAMAMAMALAMALAEDEMIFAIDPGPTESAFVVWDGALIQFGKVPNELMRVRLSSFRNGIVAIEEIASYGMPVGREVFQTMLWSGRFLEIAERNGMKVYMIPRRNVKVFMCGTMRANDASIRQALLDKIGPQGTQKQPGPTYGLKRDTWSALAIALTAEDLFKQDPWERL
jgi:hypothetical protein